MSTPTRIHVVPHFMRLHEWIALEAGLYRAEGLEPDMLTDVMHDVSSHGRDGYFERPQDRPFREGIDYSTFGLGELLVFERYPEDTFEESVAFAKRWGLDREMRQSSYSALAAPVGL